jgi:uncharacterized protein with HEPN domain
MYDKDLVRDILMQIENSASVIEERFSVVNSVDDLMDTPRGRERLDALCMQLIAIGESLKSIDKITDRELLQHYPDIDWKGAKGIRDIISHHYFDLDAEEIYYVCDAQLPGLHQAIHKMIEELYLHS